MEKIVNGNNKAPYVKALIAKISYLWVLFQRCQFHHNINGGNKNNCKENKTDSHYLLLIIKMK
jgi:hypothetical protein